MLLPLTPPTLTDHALHLHEQVKETRVTDGHIRLCVSQSNQLHYEIVHPDSWSRRKADEQNTVRIWVFFKEKNQSNLPETLRITTYLM